MDANTHGFKIEYEEMLIKLAHAGHFARRT